MRLVLRTSLLLLVIVGCKAPAPPARSFLLPNRARVIVHADGQLIVEREERDLFAIPPDFGPVIRTFEENVRGDLGIYDFRRTDETATELVAVGVPRLEGVTVVVDYTA